MTWKVKVGDFISDIIYGSIPLKNLNYHVSSRNFARAKPENVQIFDFSLLSLWNHPFLEKTTYDRAIVATHMEYADNLSKRFRHYTVFQLLERALLATGAAGDVVELGCWQGQSAHGIAQILHSKSFKNRFMIFDSFEGLSELSAEDKNELREFTVEEIETQATSLSATLETVQRNLKSFDFIDYYKGWIPERFSEVTDHKFSFVNIDVDLYQPIKDSLGFFYPRLLRGGIIFLDDYGMSQFPGAQKATEEFLKENKPSFFMYFPFGAAMIVK